MKKCQSVVGDSKIPVLLGGEHLVSYAAIKPLVEKYQDLVIVHFDAHADLRDDYLDNSCDSMRRIWK